MENQLISFIKNLKAIQKIDLDKKQELLIARTREFVNQSFKQKIISDSVLEICKPSPIPLEFIYLLDSKNPNNLNNFGRSTSLIPTPLS